jgi:hypothetical protein
MEIIIEPAIDASEMAAIRCVRRQVFAREMGITLLPIIADRAAAFHLLARHVASSKVVAALSVVETSGDDELHQRYGLDFPPGARVARYTQLAVLHTFRGLDLPLKLILEAHRRFVAPGLFDYTWLLFDADRAATSNLRRRLAFEPGAQVYSTEYGRSRVLARDEAMPLARAAIRRAAEFVAETSPACYAPAGMTLAPVRDSAI